MFKNKSVSIYGLLANENPNIFVSALMLGMISGLAYAVIFPIILLSFSPQELLVSGMADSKSYSFFNSPNSNLAGIFLINCIVIYFARAISNIGNNYLAQHASVTMRKKIYNVVGDASISDLEKVGSAKIISVLNVDVTSVVLGALTIPSILSSLVTIVGLLGYLAYLNLSVFYFVLIFLLCGVLSYQLLVHLAMKYLQKSRDVFDVVQEGMKALIYGAKELKINSKRRSVHHEIILGINEEKALKKYLIGSSILYLATGYGELLVFAVIGIAAFHLSYVYLINVNEQVGIVMSLLYISGPVGVLLNATPQIARGKVALRKMREVVNELKLEKINKEYVLTKEWSSLALNNVGYTYSNDDGESFKIEKITFEVKKGEIVYLVGGNGSGKSTLAKIISMHYIPTEGAISLGDMTLSPGNIDGARQAVGAIFSDYYLFSSICGYKKEHKSIADAYLKMFSLDQKVKISDDGEYSTLLLSDGQKKRLALLSILIEDKEIYVFDEWASDQDPQYKKIFYEVMLPNLKLYNKAIVVVTHDDTYFHNADKIVHMDYGTITSIDYK